MKNTAFEIIEKENNLSNSRILIIDKEGVIGFEFLLKLELLLEKENFPQTIFAGQNGNCAKLPNTIFIANKNINRLPLIPDYQYDYLLIVFNGEEEILEALPKFIDKAKSSKGELFFLSHYSKIDKRLIAEIISAYKEAKVIVYGDLFGQKYAPPSTITQFLDQTKKWKRLEIPCDGLSKTHPVYFEDAINRLQEVIFGKEKSSQVLFLLQKHPPTALSLAHLFQKIDPDIKVDFILGEKQSKEELVEKINGEFLIPDNYQLKEKIKKSISLWESKKFISTKSKKQRREKNSFFTSPLMSLFYSLILILILPVIATICFSFLGFNEIKSSKSSIEKGNFSLSKDKASAAKKYFEYSEVTLQPLFFESELIGKKEELEKLTRSLGVGKEAAIGLLSVSESAENFMRVFSGKSGTSKEDFIKASNSLKDAISIFQKFKTEEFNFLGLKFLPVNKNLDQSITFLTSTIDVFPYLFGFEKQRRYLLLFQNNMELRPGGGFIGSYGILTVKNGAILDFVIHDVYDADGQLKGHIEPPFAIRRYIPQVHWFLRDSNFSPDFLKNASTAAFFLNQEMEEVVDGVIAVDVSFVKNILQATGPIDVTDYNEKINAENLYMLTQTHAEKNSFPGSTQKKDFLRSAFNSIKLHFAANKNTSYLKLLESIINSISEKHLLFAFSNQDIQNIFTINNFSSSLWDNRENNQDTINDFLGVSEANLGVNKANYFLKRKISQKTIINEEGTISGQLKIDYQNTSTNTSWPGGDYRNYLRVVLPLGASLTSIEIDGNKQTTIPAITDPLIYEAKNFKPPVELEVEKTTEEEKTIYGFLTIIPSQSEKTIVINYDLTQKISANLPAFNYSLKVFKQPGTDEDPFSFQLLYPQNLKIYKANSSLEAINGLKIEGGKVVVSDKLSQDIDINLSFSKK